MIATAGLLQFKPEDRQAVLDGLKEVVRASRQDPGCIDYWWSEDIETADAFRFFECWESQETFEVHLAQPHEAAFAERNLGRMTAATATTYEATPAPLPPSG
jgi:quinol monooxygenase YgiN